MKDIERQNADRAIQRLMRERDMLREVIKDAFKYDMAPDGANWEDKAIEALKATEGKW